MSLWTASPAMLLEGQHIQYHPIQLQVSNSNGEQLLIPGRTAGQGAGFLRLLTSGCGSMEGLSAQVFSGGSCGNAKKEGAGIQGERSIDSSAQALGSSLKNGRARAINMIDNGI